MTVRVLGTAARSFISISKPLPRAPSRVSLMMATSGFRDAAVGRTELPLASMMANLRSRLNTSAINRPVNGVLSATSTRTLPFLVKDLVWAIMTSNAQVLKRLPSNSACDGVCIVHSSGTICDSPSVPRHGIFGVHHLLVTTRILIVELDGTTGNLCFGTEPVQQQLLVRA